MSSNTVSSLDETNMRDYALWVQAPAGETALPYTVGDLRLQAALASPTSGVLLPTDFVVTSSASPGNVTVSAGIGVTAPTGVTGARTRERYLFASDGPVDVPVFTNSGTVTRYHRLTIQVDDEQLAMGAASSPWTYRIYEDTGTPPTSNGGNAIALATVAVNPGQTSGYAITDLRYPCGHIMSCALSGVASGTAAISNGFRKNLYFSTEVDDPWHMADVASDRLSIRIRTAGFYDLSMSVEADGPNTMYLGMCVNAVGSDNVSIAAAEIKESIVAAPGIFSGAWGQSHVRHQLLAAGDVVRAFVMPSANMNLVSQSLRVVRSEVRS